MVDLDVLAKFGCDKEGLKKKFNLPRDQRSEKVNRLIDRIKNRVQGGRDLNLEHGHVYKALDDAWDSPFHQITPTMLSALTDKDLTSEGLTNMLKTWDLDMSEVVQEVADPKTPGKNIKQVSVPAFFKVTVPLCMAYVKIRWAKIVNDRRLLPLFKYDPVVSDEIGRLRSDVITQRVETMSRQMGYFDLMKQAVFRTLHYGECLQFPVEEWHTECQLVAKGGPFKGEDVEHGGEKFTKVVTKEGLRYHLPPPTRSYYDRAFFASTLNSDTGCSYGGYWRVHRWGDVMANKDHFYNLDQIGFEAWSKWFGQKKDHSYWTNTLQGCAIDFPTCAGDGSSKLDNEAHVARWYSIEMADKPVVITEHFEKLVPKDWDLGDYEYPVWMRLVIAADDNVIYAAPLPYPPIIWYGYDFPEGRTHNASMTLECLPFQDQFTNLLTQYLLSVKQNLANLTLVDRDVLDEKDIQEVRNYGERWWRKLNIIGVSFKKVFEKMKGSGGNPQMSVVSHKFPYQDTNALLQAMRTILDTLERVLVMSSQEVGQSASHEQTREEVRHIAQNTSTRVVFTAQAIDVARDAWKRQLYWALMAYGQGEFYAMVPMDAPMDEKKLEQLGFTYAGPYDEKRHRAYVKANDKTAIAFESFASDRDGEDRVNDVESANAMIAFLDKVITNPNLFPAVGADQAISALNYIGKFLGFPRDFKLVNTGQSASMMDQVKQSMDELKGYMDQGLQTVSTDVKGALEQIVQKNNEQDMGLQELVQMLQQARAAGPEMPVSPGF